MQSKNVCSRISGGYVKFTRFDTSYQNVYYLIFVIQFVRVLR